MKICVAQTKPVKGDIQINLKKHQEVIETAATHGAELIIFPELSLTGYEPTLARGLAITPDDPILDDLQEISNDRKLIIGVGVPTKHDRGTCISLVLFQPNQPRRIYSKKYLHPDEEEFFVSGENFSRFRAGDTTIGLAICYELSIHEHSKAAFESGAEVYIASVAKSASGVSKAAETLADIAQKYSMTVLMSNCTGPCDDFVSAGQTAVWSPDGLLRGRLDDEQEGIIIINTATQQVLNSIENNEG